MEKKQKNSLLEKALADPIRREYGLNVLFADKNKNPLVKGWNKWIKLEQTDEDIINMHKRSHTNYGYLTGFNGLVALDFDAEWIFLEAIFKFNERLLDTYIVKTPNGGYHAYYIVDHPENYVKYKKSLKVEILGKMNTIVYGEAESIDGEMVEYTPLNNEPILYDDTIIDDMKTFLRETLRKYDFLAYNCIKEKLSSKINHLTHEQRLHLSNFFLQKKTPLATVTNFFKICNDFDKQITQYQVNRTQNKIETGKLGYPRCEKLAEDFNFDTNQCNGCIRPQKYHHENQHSEPSEDIDLSKIDIDNIFSDESKIPVIRGTPIFAVEDKLLILTCIYFNQKYLLGFCGFSTGIGTNPLVIVSDTTNANPIAKIESAVPIKNVNQKSTIRRYIKEALKTSENTQESPCLLQTFSPIEDESSSDIVNELKEKIAYYIYLDRPEEHFLVTCFVLGTLMFPLFSTFGYLIVSGEKGAGKGTLLDLMSKLCWNSSNKSLSITESALFRTIAQQRPTLIIDEYHRVLKNPLSGNAIISIIESGYEKGGVVPRTEKHNDGNFKVVDYPVYSPKVLATRQPTEADDKGVKLIIPKLSGDKIYSKRKIELESDPYFENVRYSILKWVLSHYKNVLNAYRNLEPTIKLNGRDFQVWAPLLAIGKVAFEDNYHELFQFAEEYIMKKHSNSYEKENRILTALNLLLKNSKLIDGGNKLGKDVRSYKVTNKEINMVLEDCEGQKIHHTTIKSALENLKLIKYYQPGVYYLLKDELNNKLIERGFMSN